MNFEDIVVSEISQSQKDRYCMILRGVKCIETESRMVVSRSCGRRKWELLFNGSGVSVLQDEKVLEMDCGDGCTAM